MRALAAARDAGGARAVWRRRGAAAPRAARRRSRSTRRGRRAAADRRLARDGRAAPGRRSGRRVGLARAPASAAGCDRPRGSDVTLADVRRRSRPRGDRRPSAGRSTRRPRGSRCSTSYGHALAAFLAAARASARGRRGGRVVRRAADRASGSDRAGLGRAPSRRPRAPGGSRSPGSSTRIERALPGAPRRRRASARRGRCGTTRARRPRMSRPRRSPIAGGRPSARTRCREPSRDAIAEERARIDRATVS